MVQELPLPPSPPTPPLLPQQQRKKKSPLLTLGRELLVPPSVAGRTRGLALALLILALAAVVVVAAVIVLVVMAVRLPRLGWRLHSRLAAALALGGLGGKTLWMLREATRPLLQLLLPSPSLLVLLPLFHHLLRPWPLPTPLPRPPLLLGTFMVSAKAWTVAAPPPWELLRPLRVLCL